MNRGFAIVGLLLATSPAFGQNALGDGRGLDNSLEVGSFGYNRANPRRLDSELRFRNAIVTGNAANGFSFRGDVGYGGAGDFRDELGSNDLFDFRRDSLYSGLAGRGIRGTEALQYQFAMTTGGQRPLGLGGSLAMPRSGSGTPTMTYQSAGGGNGDSTLNRVDPTRLFVESPRIHSTSMRSTSSYVSSLGLEPVVVAERTAPTGEMSRLIASSLAGVRSTPLGPTTREGQQPSLRVDAGSEALRTAYDDVIERLRATTEQRRAAALEAEETPTLRPWEEQLNALREQLQQLQQTGIPIEPSAPDMVQPVRPAVDEDELGEILRTIREAGGDLNALIPTGVESRDIYAEHMRSGERMLREQRFFDAEERFTRALAGRPGDAMAQVGRLNAQLGAGMFLSSAVNLRQLLIEHPELTGVRYGPELRPTDERERFLIERLIRNLEGEIGAPDDAALLLAYIGFQREDAETIERGLNVLTDLDKAANDGKLTPLTHVLRGVWLTEE